MSIARTKLRELIENDFDRVEEIWKEVTAKQEKHKSTWVTCKHCNHRNEAVVTVDSYALKDVISFLGFAASYGVGKPPEEKQVYVDITARRLQDMSDEELNAIIDGTARELPA